MKREGINYVVVGAFVVIALALLVAAMIRMTGRGAERDHYFVHYDNVLGILRGTPVTFEGYPIGQVSAIDPRHSEGATVFVVDLSVEAGWQIPEDSMARIVAPGLLASFQIDIEEGAGPGMLPPGGVIHGAGPVNLVDTVNTAAQELYTVSHERLVPLLATLEEYVRTIGGDLSRRIPEITAEVAALVNQLRAVAGNLQELSGEESRLQIRDTLRNAAAAARNLEGLSRDLNGSRARLDRLLTDADGVVAENRDDLRAAMEGLRATMDVIVRSSDVITYNLESTSRNLNEFSRQVRDNPAVLLGGEPPHDNVDAGR